ncbi:MAG: hypothetical protein AAFN94_08215 [Pseudomonadota bacterium]
MTIFRCAALSAALAFPLSTADAQTIKDIARTGTGLVSDQKTVVVSEDSLLPFGDGFASRAQATQLLQAEGLSYVAHIACDARTCTDGSAPATGAPDLTQFQITGLHPRHGLQTIVLVDAPCKSARRSLGAATARASGKTPGCFADFTAPMRIRQNLGHTTHVDGWTTWGVFEIDLPRRARVKTKDTTRNKGNGKGIWQHVMTLTLQNNGYGWARLSDGAYNYLRMETTDADGTVLSLLEKENLTIPSVGGGNIPFDPGSVLRPSDVVGKRLNRTPGQIRGSGSRSGGTAQTISSPVDAETLAYCQAVSAAKGDIKRAEDSKTLETLEAVYEVATAGYQGTKLIFSEGMTAGGDVKALELGSAHTASAEVQLGEIDLTDNIRRDYEAQAKGLAAYALLGCLDEHGVPTGLSPEDLGLIAFMNHLDDTVEDQAQEFEIIATTTFDGSGCEAGSWEEDKEVNGQVCTNYVNIQKREDGTCERTEVLVCGGDTVNP